MQTLRAVGWPGSAKEILGSAVQASDGRIGWVRDLYLDDRHWTIRHVVVDTPRRVGGRRVLLPPEAIEHVDRAHRMLQTRLTRRQVSLGPSSDVARPVFRQHELEMGRYYRFPSYVVSVGAAVALAPVILEASRDAHSDPHLRSIRAMTGYHLHAIDGDVGRVSDFVIEDRSWDVGHLVVSLGLWWPTRTVLVPVGWIADVSWGARAVDVSLPAEPIRLAPSYDPRVGLGGEYEERVRRYYGPAPFGERSLKRSGAWTR
jgi:sporulation protein YlmC with PRC-barrel domain